MSKNYHSDRLPSGPRQPSIIGTDGDYDNTVGTLIKEGRQKRLQQLQALLECTREFTKDLEDDISHIEKEDECLCSLDFLYGIFRKFEVIMGCIDKVRYEIRLNDIHHIEKPIHQVTPEHQERKCDCYFTQCAIAAGVYDE